MKLFTSILGALALACAAAGAQAAPTTTTDQPSLYQDQVNHAQMALGVNLFGRDSVDQHVCLVGGPDTTCQLPGSSSVTSVDIGTKADTACSGAPPCSLIAWTAEMVALAASPLPAQPAHGVLVGGVEGVAASASADTDNPLNGGCRAATASPTAVTDGQKVAVLCSTEGKQVLLPYAIKELNVRGAANTTGTGATTIIAAQGAGLKIYVTAVQCWREDAGTTPIHATLDDSATTPIPMPAGGGSAPTFPTPLAVAANTALTFAPSAGVTTAYCNAQGFVGP